MKDLCNLDELSIYVQYVDINNEYGWVIINNLSTHRFLWKKVEDFTPEKVDELVKKDKRGYLLEIDVKYPKQLHENYNELPFLVEKMKIEEKKN